MKDKIYIDRIIKYAKKICRYIEEVHTFKDFENNDEKVDAVILNLEQIGETAKKLSDETKQNHPSIHWPSIIGLRNMISHEYEGIRLNIIYDIATVNIPELLSKLDK
jgi:uncharacterized protein with HEPN domain